MDKVKIGFIGSGGAAKLHARNLKNFPEVHIQAFSDVDEKTAQEASQEFGGTVYKAYDKMLEQESLDATYICTPPMVRLDPIAKACEKGLHIFLEKPFAPTLDEGKKIYRAVSEAGKNFQIGYQSRYQPAVRRARDIITDGSMGPITMFYGEYWADLPAAPWWSHRTEGGGQVIEQATHIFDLSMFLLGDVDTVYSTFDYTINKDKAGFDVEDSAATIISFKSGVRGCITNTCNYWGSPAFIQARVVGREASVIIKPFDVEIFIFRKLQLPQPWWATRPTGPEHFENNLIDGYYNEDRAFIDSIIQNDKSKLINITEAYKSLAVTYAAFESSKTKKEVKVENPP
ncbi:Gfo/Idh/MocA family protein [[Eubacterium] cellulosolvens]